MGSLYLARDPDLDRLVAIKLLKDDYQDDQDFRERFAREARALARLRHQNIIVVYDFGEHEGRLFMAMEYIDGETLTRRLARPPALSLVQALDLIGHLCAGLSSAHDAGIVHRDIKPDNIMLDRHGVLKLLDFGIARQTHADSTFQMTQPGMMIGTYAYMSPEQLLGQAVDKRSDIFSVGTVLYEVVGGAQAFPGTFAAVYNSILTTGPVPLEERVPGVDPRLVGIVRRALERNPEQRYQSARDMRQDVGRMLQHLTEPTADRGDGRTSQKAPTKGPSALTGRDIEAKRGLVAEQIRLSREAFERGEHETALQYAERAAFVDPESEPALDLVNRSRLAIDTKLVLKLLKESNRALAAGHFDEALALAEKAATTIPDIAGTDGLKEEVLHVSDQIRQAREREERINSSLQRARLSFEQGQYDTALRAAYEVLALDPEREEARALEQKTKEQLRLQRELEQARREAHSRLHAARTLASEGKWEEATAAIDHIAAPSESVRRVVAEALEEIRTLQHKAAIDAQIAQARAALAAGNPDQAVALVDTIAANDQTDDSRDVRASALSAIARRRELEQKKQRLDTAMALARQMIDRGQLADARVHVQEALDIGLEPERVGELRRQLEELEAAENRRRQEALEAEAARIREEQRIAAERRRQEEEAARKREEQQRLTQLLASIEADLADDNVSDAAARLRQAEEFGPIAEGALARRHAAAQSELERRLQGRTMVAPRAIPDSPIETIARPSPAETMTRLTPAETVARPSPAETIARPSPVETIVRPPTPRTVPQRAPHVRPSPVPRARPSQGKALIAVASAILAVAAIWFVLKPSGPRTASTAIEQPAPPVPAAPVNRQEVPTSPRSTDARGDNPAPAPGGLPSPTRGPVSPPPEDPARQARATIQEAMQKGELERAARVLRDAQARFGVAAFQAELQTITKLQAEQDSKRQAAEQDKQRQAAIQDLLEAARKQRDHSTAIDILNKALQIAPGDARIQSALKQRTESLAAERTEAELDAKRQQQANERNEGVKNVLSAIDRALDRGDVEGADVLIQGAEQRFGAEPFRGRRQRLSTERTRAVTATAERVQGQIRNVLSQFAAAYSSKNETALAALWPGFPQASFRSTFRSFESLSWTFGACAIDVSAPTATALCPVAIKRVDLRGRSTSEEGRRRFVLRNLNGMWLIESMQVQ
jgi:tetratricopeptide (TPR) repeat protein